MLMLAFFYLQKYERTSRHLASSMFLCRNKNFIQVGVDKSSSSLLCPPPFYINSSLQLLSPQLLRLIVVCWWQQLCTSFQSYCCCHCCCCVPLLPHWWPSPIAIIPISFFVCSCCLWFGYFEWPKQSLSSPTAAMAASLLPMPFVIVVVLTHHCKSSSLPLSPPRWRISGKRHASNELECLLCSGGGWWQQRLALVMGGALMVLAVSVAIATECTVNDVDCLALSCDKGLLKTDSVNTMALPLACIMP